MRSFTRQIKECALNLGFHKVGITSAQQPSKSEHLSKWLQNNYQGTMHWMKKHADKRQNILKLVPGARSVICVAHNYYIGYQHSSDKKYAKISRYAWGKDYHKVMKKKLKQLLQTIEQLDPTIEGRLCVDTAPIMEKLWAEKAGLGWQGKHTNLITREFGSWVFLGELIINKSLNYDQPAEDMCGTCTACIKVCPTDAIIEPGILDATRCISYLTIEFWDKPIPDSFAKDMNNWIFGCDICQDVCPWNRFQKETDEDAYLPNKELTHPLLIELADLSEKEYQKRFKYSPLSRLGWRNFLRNVQTVLQKYTQRINV
jgi:epoxyqueuosine reductase